MILLPVLCACFLLGAIPTGVLVGRLKGIDVRRQGSGNVGATNVYRTAGKLPGLLVLIVDTLKGWFPVAFVATWALRQDSSLSPETTAILTGIAAVAGHIWNPFLQFKGGKGVATSLGVLFGLSYPLAFWTTAVWLIAALLTRYVSIASISAAMAAPFLMLALGLPTPWVLGGVFVAIAVVGRHRENILRLLHGEENRIGRKKIK